MTKHPEPLYKDLLLPNRTDRPFFYTNFVTTIDGKIQVIPDTKAYWPIGSEVDYATLLQLRSLADVLIHGKNTALWHRTLDTLGKEQFQQLRKKSGKSAKYLYIVISAHPSDDLIQRLENPPDGVEVLLATTLDAHLSDVLKKAVPVMAFGTGHVDLDALSAYLFDRECKQVLIEGGPSVLGSFFKQKLVDEIYLTIAAKVIGNENKSTITMVEGYMFPPDQIPKCELLSMQNVQNELYLRYSVSYQSGKH
jgi:riboflavin biosynthesis pyrimidine reductase